MRSLSQLLADWRAANSRLQNMQVPRIIGNVAVRVVKDNFRLQGYDSGTGVKKWPARKDSTNKRYDKRYGVKGSVYQSSNPVLSQTRNLKDSVKYKADERRVDVGVNPSLIPYAEIHNKGGQGKAWGKYSFKMEQRKFIPADGEPPNPKILNAAQKKIVSERNKIMKEFKK